MMGLKRICSVDVEGRNPLLMPFQRSKFYWVCLLVTVVLGYGFTLTNFSMGIDDEAYGEYFGQNGLAMQGRVGYIFTRLIFDSYEYLPIWRELLAVIILIIAITLWVDFLIGISGRKFDDTAGAIFACVAVSCPFMAEKFLFAMSAAATAFTYLITIIGIRCFFAWAIDKKSNGYIIGSVMILTYGFLYENSNIMYYSICALSGIYLMFFNETYKDFFNMKSIRNLTFKFIAVILISMLLAMIIRKLTLSYLGLPLLDYSRGYVIYDTSHMLLSIIKLVLRLMKSFAIDLIQFGKYFYFVLAGIVFFLISIIYSNKKKNVFFILVFIAMAMTAILPFLITGNIDLPGRILDPIGLFTGIACSIIYVSIKRFELKKISFKYVYFTLILILILNQTMAMTKIFYVDYQKYQLDVYKTNEIMYEVEKIADNKKPIIFLGIPEGYNLDKEGLQGWSIFEWDRIVTADYELDSHRLYNFFNQHGYHINKPDMTKVDIENLKKEVTDMAVFPKEGSIIDNGDYILVKLGESKLKNY